MTPGRLQGPTEGKRSGVLRAVCKGDKSKPVKGEAGGGRLLGLQSREKTLSLEWMGKTELQGQRLRDQR